MKSFCIPQRRKQYTSLIIVLVINFLLIKFTSISRLVHSSKFIDAVAFDLSFILGNGSNVSLTYL